MAGDKLSTRLSSILMSFNNGESFTIEELAKEFDVDIRTIQRDLKDRLSFMPIKKENGRYSLESYALGKLNYKDLKNFAILSGISELYPSLEKEFISDLLNEKVNKAFLIQIQNFQQTKKDLFEKVSQAIIAKNKINFIYKEKQRIINPYKLINNNGIWYILGEEDEKLKTYVLNKALNLKILKENFVQNENFLKQIQENENTWISDEKFEVVLKISNQAKEYFLRKKIFSNFNILSENDENFTIAFNATYEDEILNFVKQWIPYVKIIKPLKLKERLDEILKEYLKN